MKHEFVMGFIMNQFIMNSEEQQYLQIRGSVVLLQQKYM